MELTDLKVFLRIAEEGNITRAAEQQVCAVNVTARVKSENELGVPYSTDTPMGDLNGKRANVPGLCVPFLICLKKRCVLYRKRLIQAVL